MAPKKRDSAPSGESGRIHGRIVAGGLLSFFLPFIVYVLTLAPTVTLEDSGELITAARYLGVAHPPGYPLWCIVAHLFTRLPFATVAERVHLVSAFFAGMTCFLVFLIGRRLTRSSIASLFGALALGFSKVLWSQSVIAEVYTLNTFLTALALWLIVRWREDRRALWLYWFAFVIGIGLTNHQVIGPVGVILYGWVVATDRRAAFRARTLLYCLALGAAGLLVYMYLPLRASADPPLNWGDPDTLHKALRHVLRADYASAFQRTRYSGNFTDLVKHWTDATWQLGSAFTWPLFIMGLTGGLAALRRRALRPLVIVSVIVMAANMFMLPFLLKPIATPGLLYVFRVYYLPAHVFFALWIIFACREVSRRLERLPRQAGRVAACAVLLAALYPLGMHYQGNDRSDDWLAHDFGLDYLSGVPPNAGLLPISDEVGFVCTYLKWVEGVRADVRILQNSLGWKGEPVEAIICEVPVTAPLVDRIPIFSGAVSIPWGMAYRLVGKENVSSVTYGMFQPLPRRPHPPGPRPAEYDPFTFRVRGYYARYFARLGAKRLSEGTSKEAEEAFSECERLMDQDAYAHVLLARIFREFGIHEERIIPLLETALLLLKDHYDPWEYRFYPVTIQQINDELKSVYENALPE